MNDDYSERITIDVDKLKKDLIDECEAAFFGGGFGGALIESFDLERMSPEKLVQYAIDQGIDIRRYQC